MHTNVVLQLVPRATHLFEEAGALEQVADLASGWFLQWLLKPEQFSKLLSGAAPD